MQHGLGLATERGRAAACLAGSPTRNQQLPGQQQPDGRQGQPALGGQPQQGGADQNLVGEGIEPGPPYRAAAAATGQKAIGGIGAAAEQQQPPGQGGLVGPQGQKERQAQAGPQDCQEIGEAAQDNQSHERLIILPRYPPRTPGGGA